MKQTVLLMFFVFSILFFTKTVFSVDFEVSVEPSEVNVGEERTLIFNVTNLNDSINVTFLNISFPFEFVYRGFSKARTDVNCMVSPQNNYIFCSADALIEPKSSFLINITGSMNTEKLENYTFVAETNDTNNEKTTKQVNVTVVDRLKPFIVSVTPANNTRYTYSEGRTYVFEVNVRDNLKVSSSTLQINSNVGFSRVLTNYTSLKSGVISLVVENLPAGEYNFSWMINDTAGNYNFSGWYYFNITRAANPIDVYLNNQKNTNITVVNGTEVNITAVSKGDILVFLNDVKIGESDIYSQIRVFNEVGLFRLFFNSSGNQNYTRNSTGVSYWIRVIYPRLTYSIVRAPSTETYSPGKSYEIRVEFTSPAFPNNNITNVSFIFGGRTYYLSVSNTKTQVFSYTLRDLKAGEYSWRYCAEDSQKEEVCVSGTFYVNKAVPELDIYVEKEYLTPVNKTIIALGCPEQIVCNFYLNNTKLSQPYYELITNKAGYYVFVYNTTGNENYTSYEVKKTVRVIEVKTEKQEEKKQETSGTVRRDTTPTREKKLITFKPNQPNVIDVENETTLKFRQIIVMVNQEERNVSFEVLPPANIPQKTPPGIVFSYVEIKTNLSSNKVVNVRFKFRVEKRWVENNQIDVSTIFLYRWNGTEWEKLNTTKTTEDENNFYFDANSTRFSIFAISGQRVNQTFPWTLILILIVVIAVIGFLLYIFLPTSRKDDYEKLKERWREKIEG
ncbi:MAG: PGF-pre-PGF domain-containing protein [Candidatus Aenigmarchaeota archaeon]|nr:PGF-pre-PGF domain-containing protein [Candidatus Aenigmarchaeota archaeon]